MFRPYLLALSLLLAAAGTAEASWWWPFGTRDEWNRVPPAQQNREAAPLMDSALAAARDGASGRALDLFEEVSKRYPGSRYAPEALFQTGQLEMRRSKWKRAFEAFQKIIDLYPDFPQFTEVIAAQFECATSLAEGIKVRYFFLIPFKNYDRAVQYYDRIVASAPYSDYAPLALMNIALIEGYRNREAEAIDALDRLINNYPSSLLTSNAYLELADTFAGLVEGPLYDQGATREAISYYQDFLILYPGSPEVAQGEQGLSEMQEVLSESKFVLGEYYYKYRKNYTAAKVFLNEAITVAPNSQAAGKSRALLEKIASLEASLPPPPPPDLTPRLPVPRRSFWDRLAFWEKDLQAPAAAPAPKQSFWRRLKFWDRSAEPAPAPADAPAAPAPEAPSADPATPSGSAETAPTAPAGSDPVAPKKSLWRRLKFWDRD